MARPKTATDIARLGLAHISQYTVSTLTTEDNYLNTVINEYYDLELENVLRENAWNFALKPAELHKITEGPQIRYFSKYSVPSDYVREGFFGDMDNPILGVKEIGTFFYVRNNLFNSLEANERDTLSIFYVYRFTNITLMPSHFVKLLYIGLSRSIVTVIQGFDRGLRQQLNEDYETQRKESTYMDNRGSPPIKVFRSKQHAARVSGIGGMNNSTVIDTGV